MNKKYRAQDIDSLTDIEIQKLFDNKVVTAVPLKWASRSLKQLKHSLLEEVFHMRRFESVILQPINGLLYEQKQICVRTIG